MSAVRQALAGRAAAAARALRGFLVGFTGMPAARLDAGCAHARPADGAREALAERAVRRPSCC
jgi:hypothetical protein